MNKLLERYREYTDAMVDMPPYSFLASEVFDLVTYDDSMDEMLVKDLLEICKVILNKTNFEYIKDEKNYVKYITLINLPCFSGKLELEWGTSIRGAWFDEYEKAKKFLEEIEEFINTSLPVKLNEESQNSLISDGLVKEGGL